MTRTRSLWIAVPLLLLLLAAACSSSNNNSKSNSSNAPASGASNSQKTNSGSGSSSDCAYASKLNAARQQLTQVNVDELTTASTGSVADQTAALGKALDKLIGALNQSLSTVKSSNPPSDFKAYNDAVASALQTTLDKWNSAKTSLGKGDLNGALSSLTEGGDSFGSALTDLQTKYPQLEARINKCPTPNP